ncbi:MAG: right-handed parallel beta-helix repeat-containing protein [Gemmataceae bacterium]|nr:right-handed parallel beta-helix repeat-containing protein [Gemmataceae bacterium]
MSAYIFRTSKTNRNARKNILKGRRRLWVQSLEDRTVPTTYVVSNLLDDNSAGSLRGAIALANADATPGPHIIDATGVSGTITLSQATINIAISSTQDMTINGPGAGSLTVSGAVTAGATNRIFNITSAKTISINNIKLASGNLTTGNNGGAILNSAANTLKVSGVTFSGNKTAGTGGVISMATAGATLNVTNCTFTGNSATGAGGVIGLAAVTTVTLTGSSFTSNISGGAGGVVNSATGASTITVDGCTLTSNTGSTGGALSGAATGTTYNLKSSDFVSNRSTGAGGALYTAVQTIWQVDQCQFTNNTAAGGVGGAVRMTSTTPTFNVTNSSFTGNSSSSNGGAIYFAGSSANTFTISGSTFSKNTAATTGGALWIGSSATYTVNNSTFSGNVANGNVTTGGGGAINVNSTAVLNINNSTIFGNTASGIGFGGGIRRATATGTTNIISTIIAGNGAGTGPDMSFSAAVTVNGGANLIGVADVGNFTLGTGSGANVTGTLASPLDAKLGPLQDNGGPTLPHTFTHKLLSGSPAFNVGNQNGLTLDQTGAPRPASGADIGSVEGFTLDPSAKATLSNVTTAGGTVYTATVVYTDETAINTGSIDVNDVKLSGGGFGSPVSPIAAAFTGSGGSVTATYDFTPPGGAWDDVDNGTYTLSMVAGQVFDTDGPNSVAAGGLGSFKVSIPLPILVVDNPGDTDDGNYGPGQQTFREAVVRANNALGTVDSITFDASLNNSTITVGSEIAVSDGLVINGPGSAKLTLAGAGANRLFNIDATGTVATITLNGLTISGFTATGAGGAILNTDESLVLNDVVLKSNSSSANGGAIAATGAFVLTIGNSTITQNSTTGTGGAINLASTATITIDKSTFSLNKSSGNGAGLQTTGISTSSITMSVFAQNSAGGSGGGFYHSGNVALTIADTTFSDNTSTIGGGFRTAGSLSTVTMDRSSVTGNLATSTLGGGAYIGNGGLVTINSSTFANNTATTSGGAIRFSTHTVTVNNSTFSGNVANGATTATGGGAIVLTGAGIVTINNSTIAKNSVPNSLAKGGGIFSTVSTNTITINSTIIADNTNSNQRDLSSNGTLPRAVGGDSNFFGAIDPAVITLTGINDPLLVGTEATPVDPTLGPLANNGGPTLTHLLKSGSLAFDKGNNNAGLTFDQRGTGFPRTLAGITDIGATERVTADPFAKATLVNVTTAGGTVYTATVVYNDENAINTATIDVNDVTLSGAAFPTPVSPFAAAFTGSGGSVTATYDFTPPGGAWDYLDDGVYSLNMVAAQVFDTDGPNSVAPGSIGTFTVGIPLPPLVVDNAGDTIDGNYGPGQFTLREAIAFTNAAGGSIDSISFAPALNGSTITFGSEIKVTDGVIINGPGAALLTFAGSGTNRLFNIDVVGSVSSITFTGVTMTGGTVTGAGGAILNSDETLELNGVLLTANSSSASGGAIAFVSAGSLVIGSSTISQNTTTGTGGAINMAGTATITIDKSTFSGNRSSSNGAGLQVTGIATSVITKSLFSQNTAGGSGGGIYHSGNVDLSIADSTFSDNTGTIGGGFRTAGSLSTVTMDRSTVSGNTATSSIGGGAYIGNGGTVTLNNSTFANNTAATSGGGIRFATHTVVINNSTFSGNVANGSTTATGGGAIVITSSGNVTINNSTIAKNSVPNATAKGGGIFSTVSTSVITINSTILADNSNGTSRDLGSNGTLPRAVGGDGNLFGAIDPAVITLTGTNALVGTESNPLDPFLGPLASNGGPTQTHLLLSGSPAFDAGNNLTGLMEDQRGTGFPRTIGVGTDIGATERVNVDPSAKATLTNVTTAGGTTYTVVIVYADETAINTASIDTNDITLSGGAFGSPVSPTGVSVSGSGGSVTATYTFTPPGGAWDSSDNGTYTVTMVANQVFDTDGPHPVAPNALGTFKVAIAASYVVDNVSDVDDNDFSAGQFTLREAVRLSNTSAGLNDTISFAPALSGQTITITGGEMTITDPFNLQGLGASNLTITSNLASRLFNFAITGSLSTTVTNISDVRLHQFKTTAAGGVLLLNSNPVTLSKCLLTENTATTLGGVVNLGATTITLNECTATLNVATTNGGVVGTGTGQMVVNKSVLTSNSAITDGGALFMNGAGKMTISDSTISNNVANGNGGGLNAATGTITLTNVTVSNNSAGAAGGGLRGSSSVGVTMTNCTFTGNRSTTTGGAVHFAGGNQTINNSTFSGNRATTTGGAIATATGSVTLTITDGKFTDNRAITTGGAISTGTTSTVSLTNSTFQRNFANLDGGAIHGASTCTLTVTGSLFEDNETGSTTGAGGGAIHIGVSTIQLTNSVFRRNNAYAAGGAVNVVNVSTFTADDCIFENNNGGNGGAARFSSTGTFTFNNCVVTGNTSFRGGGMYLSSTGNLVVNASTIANNSAASANGGGGGICLFSGSATITNSTISGNYAQGYEGGGGIELRSATWAGTLDVRNSTIYNNTAKYGFGGGIQRTSNTGIVSLSSTIVAGNTGNVARDIYSFAAGGSFAVNNVLIGANDATSNITLSGTFDPLLVGTEASPVDPGLYPLLYNGGKTPTHALRVGSKALDAGNDFFTLGTDQRGGTFARVVGVAADLGAVEGVSNLPFATSTPVNVPPAGTDYIVSVVYEDETGINVSSIDVSDLKISGPGFGTPASPFKVLTSGSGTKVTANYYFTPPGGAWDAGDNGIYTVSITGTVQDTDAVPNSVNLGVLNQFRVGFGQSYVVDIVTDEDDGITSKGDLSLREAIRLANTNVGTDSITFDPSVFGSAQTITLTLGELGVSDSVGITGPGASLLTINANSLSRHFNVAGLDVLDVTLSGMTLTGGSTALDGGSIRSFQENLTLSKMAITGNKAGLDGGAVSAIGQSAKLTISDSTISNNSAVVGGGLNLRLSVTTSISRSTISGNTANADGGGIYFWDSGSLTLDSSTLSGNTANATTADAGGGGIYFFGIVTAGGFTVSNSTISGNKSTLSGGGGIALDTLVGSVLIQNSTITGNDGATGGGGLAVTYTIPPGGFGTVTVQSSIIAGNLVAGVVDATSDLKADIATNLAGNNNLIGVVDAAGNMTLTGTGNLTGTLATPLDPLLAPLALNGAPAGSPLTHALLVGSPAIDAGNNGAALSFDQRGPGFIRVANLVADIGAFEVQPVATPAKVLSVSVNGGGVQRSNVTSLVVTFDNAPTFVGAPAAAFTLERFDGGVGTGTFVTLAANVLGNTVTLTFSGALTQAVTNSLIDGVYQLRIDDAQISNLDGDANGTIGGDYATPTTSAGGGIFRLFGDADGNATVNSADFLAFRLAFLSSSPTFDFDGNGQVDTNDFLKFRLNFLKSV